MNIVINGCFGGFGLSHEAEKLYAKKSGIELFHYYQAKMKHRDGEDLYLRFSDKDNAPLGITYAFTKDHGNSFSEFPHGDDSGYWYDRDLDRSDPVLVEVVRELGEKANGQSAKLEIVEIPDGVDWEIDEYDGNEHVAEKHRTWR